MKNKTSLYFLFILLLTTGLFFLQGNAKEQTDTKIKLPAQTLNWPSFRGYRSTGVSYNQDLPLHWDGKKGKNILWEIPVPGLGHSSPVIWQDKLFLTTAIGSKGKPFLRTGLYGESPDNPENYPHDFKVYCISATTGKILWEKTSYTGVPKVQRHIKSSHANSSIATDGNFVVAFFGSEGLYCYNMEGELQWKKDLGLLDSGAFNRPKIQWGFASSPEIYKNQLIVLCDVNNQSFITSFDLKSGKELWRTLRDEGPTWGSPAIYEGKNRTLTIVNGYRRIAAYDIKDGKEVWWLKGGGDVPVPTPIVKNNQVFFSNAHGKLRPIIVIDLESNPSGNISLKPGETSNKNITWYKPRKGCYLPTPIVYGKYLYIADDRGMLSCYEAETGKELYRQRITGNISPHCSSPAAADGKLYITDEHGQTNIVKAGPEFKLLASNQIGKPCLASVAISQKKLFIRTSTTLLAVGKTKK